MPDHSTNTILIQLPKLGTIIYVFLYDLPHFNTHQNHLTYPTTFRHHFYSV